MNKLIPMAALVASFTFIIFIISASAQDRVVTLERQKCLERSDRGLSGYVLWPIDLLIATDSRSKC